MGILAALIIVSLQSSQKKAGDADRKTKARSLASAISQYFVENNKYPYDAADPGGIGLTGGTGAPGGVNIENSPGTECGAILKSTLVSTPVAKKYLEAHGACLEKDPNLTNRYRSLTSEGKYYYTIAWELKYQGEAALPNSGTGYGVYLTTTGGAACATPLDGPPVGSGALNGSSPRLAIACLKPQTKHFVVHGD